MWDDEVARLARQADGFRDVTVGVGVEQAKAVGLCLPAADAGNLDTLFSLGIDTRTTTASPKKGR
jgi:hypothetical protein